MTTTILTTQDILAAAAYAVAHPADYDQRAWCGTPCCVLGHARRLAGLPPRAEGPAAGEYPDASPRAAMLRAMLHWSHADTAALMAYVGTDGVLRVPPGGIGAFGDGATVERGATVEADTDTAE